MGFLFLLREREPAPDLSQVLEKAIEVMLSIL